MKQVKIYDTTLRDGSQGEGVSFSVEEKLKVAAKLDEVGVHYIEGGWPGSNPKDMEFFRKAKEIKFKHSILVAFGSTRRVKNKPEDDENLKAFVKSGARIACIFGKTWDLHITDVIKTTLENNLEIISDSIGYLINNGIEPFYDAEHFFDGYKANKDYAIKTLQAAEKAGAVYIILCDTNGGTLPTEIKEIIREVKKNINCKLGIHAHNDSDLGTANTLAAVEEGCVMVHGTVNGYGERCGNANLCSIIPNLQIKMKYQCLDPKRLQELTHLAIYIAELANLKLPDAAPFVGHSAFTHKAGVHVDAMKKNELSYEHMTPEAVGNKRRILISELSGVSNVIFKGQSLGVNLDKDTPETKEILNKVKELEKLGYNFEGAEASFEILMKKVFKTHRTFFTLEDFGVTVDNRGGKVGSKATIKVKVNDNVEHTAAEGTGPVDALNNALRKALEVYYPSLKSVHLRDFKVRIVDPQAATKALTRVVIESTDGKDIWNTIGVSQNMIEASWLALVDSIEYKLLKDGVQ